MRSLNYDFFKDKIVFITGHTGFIGSWLSILMLEFGAKVIGYALPPLTENDNFVLAKLEEKITHIIGDIRDYDKLNNSIKDNNPDIILHLAAQPIVRKSYLFPKETYDVNVGGTVNVFEAFRKSISSKLMINLTSDKCYENIELNCGYNENDRVGGFDPYSSSKACSELITSAYRNSFFSGNNLKNNKNVSSVRFGNVIGGGDWQEDRLIPDLMKAIKNNSNFQIRSPNSVRPWQYVLEPLRGLLVLTMKMWEDINYTGAWNFGPNNADVLTVNEIIKKILHILNKEDYPIEIREQENSLHETKCLLLNIDKAKKDLGWNPKLHIDDSIKFLCDWYKEEIVNYEFDIKQIKDYFKKINN